MADNTCTGDCSRCSFPQQVYCAARHGHAIMNNQKAIVERLDRIDQSLAALAAPNGLINPMEDSSAQEDPGADNRGRKK